MTATTAPVPGRAGAPAGSGIVSVKTRPAKTLPGLVGVLLALVGLGLIAGGGVGVTVAGQVAALTPVVNTGSGR